MSDLISSFQAYFHSFHRVIFTLYHTLKKCLLKVYTRIWSWFSSPKVSYEVPYVNEWVTPWLPWQQLLPACVFCQLWDLTLSLSSQRILQGLILCEVRYFDGKIKRVLGGFLKLRKVTVSAIMSVCPSVYQHGTTRLPLGIVSWKYLPCTKICWEI